jgi:hypothetical protein
MVSLERMIYNLWGNLREDLVFRRNKIKNNLKFNHKCIILKYQLLRDDDG